MSGHEQSARATAETGEPLVEVRGLRKYYETGPSVLGGEPVKAVDGVSFDIRPGETFGLVGESGCGKTTLGRTLLQLETVTDGVVRFDGRDVTELSGAEQKDWRRNVGMVFQDPESSLNERMTVGEIVREPLDVHDWETARDRRRRVRELLDTVGLQPEHYHRYPHQFSGGQRQRIGIARALALNPEFVVLDEPVSALDVSVQAQVLNLLEDLQDEYGLTYMFIAHDLSVVRHICDRVAVMYLGNVLELGRTAELFEDPANPYTISLLSAVPEPDPTSAIDRITLRGTPPNPRDPPKGCPFSTRCPMKIRPDGFHDVDDDVWQQVEVFREVVRERSRLGRSLSDRVAGLLGRDTVRADVAELRADLFGDVSLPPSVAGPVDDAMDHLEANDPGAARDVLAGAFDGDCDAEPPDPYEVSPTGRTSRCHLHREDETDPRSSVEWERSVFTD